MDACLIMGGAGYIGSHMVHALLEQGHPVVVMDNLSTGLRNRLPPEVPFYESDFACTETLAKVFNAHTIGLVMHFAASIWPFDSIENPRLYYDNNVHKSVQLLDWLVAHDLKYFIFSSTAAVYAGQDSGSLSEDAPIKPITPYGRSKAMFEWVLEDYARAYDFKAVSLRYFNAAGVEPFFVDRHLDQSSDKVIPAALCVASGDVQRMKIFGDQYPTPDGTCIRDFVHVMDICDAHWAAYQYLVKGGASRVFNIGCGKGYSVKEVVQAAREVTGHPIPIEVAAPRPGDLPRAVASIDAIQRSCAWSPKRSALDVMIQSMWAG